MKEDECNKFIDTKSQVDSIIVWLPRMEQKRDELFKEVEKNRNKFKLNI
jgi:hypothetical protein